MRESLGSTKPTGRMKVKVGLGSSVAGSVVPRAAAHCRPVSAATSARRSKSVHVGTRKMVNYA